MFSLRNVSIFVLTVLHRVLLFDHYLQMFSESAPLSAGIDQYRTCCLAYSILVVEPISLPFLHLSLLFSLFSPTVFCFFDDNSITSCLSDFVSKHILHNSASILYLFGLTSTNWLICICEGVCVQKKALQFVAMH